MGSILCWRPHKRLAASRGVTFERGPRHYDFKRANMDDNTPAGAILERLQRASETVATVLAAVLYAVVLGSAIVRTVFEGEPAFSEATLRMANLLSGLVGSVVAAGFARSRRPSAAPVIARHPIGGGNAPTGWYTLKPPSRFRAKFLGLAAMLGVRVRVGATNLSDVPSPADEPPISAPSYALWVALVYFVVYFVVGVGAFALVITRPAVPELISNAAWVLLGTIVTSAYAYFGMDMRT